MLLVIFLTGAILWNLPWSKYENGFLVSAVEPGYLDFDNLPETNFSCEGKVIGGYYADVETGCQMFHVCTIGLKSEITDIKFLCLNGTVFDQETRVCERLDEVDCSKSESFFDLNLELYGNNGGGYGIQAKDENRDEEGEQNQCEDEYDEEGSCSKKSEPDENKQNAQDIGEEIEYDWEEANTPSSTTSSTTSSSTTQSTTTAKQITTSSRPSSSSPPSKFHYRPEIVPFSTTTPNTIQQLLALHEAFQDNLKRRDPQTNGKLGSSGSSTLKPVASKTPYEFPNAPQSHYTSHSNKLPNSFSNLSQNVHFSSLTPNRNPTQTAYKPEPAAGFYKQNSQKVANKPIPSYSSSSGPAKNPNTAEPPYAYKIANNDSPSRFRPVGNSPAKPAPETFKMEPVPQLAHSTFTIAQNKPYPFRSKMSLEEDTESETSEMDEQRAQQKLENFSHTNFARAIPERTKTPKNASDTVSVVLTTSSVSSSISSKPRSAISSNANSVVRQVPELPARNSFVSNSSSSTTLSSKIPQVPQLTLNYPNITDINESLTEESYYEEARSDYDDNSQEYKDVLYQTDVQKIKQ